MNESPVTTLEEKRDRRGLLALIGAGGAAAVAGLLSRSNGARAHGKLEVENNSSVPAIHGWNHGSGAGVFGTASTGFGVYGNSFSGDGVRGWHDRGSRGAGVHGFSGVDQTDAAERVGVRGVGVDTGVRGEGKTGVSGAGKWAVLGKANSVGGAGVYGNAGSGSTGVYATASGTKVALQVNGRSRFKQSGKTAVSAGASSKVVPLTFTLASGSLIVATLQKNAGSGVAVRTAGRYGSNKIRITLTKAATKSATIAYFIFTP